MGPEHSRTSGVVALATIRFAFASTAPCNLERLRLVGRNSVQPEILRGAFTGIVLLFKAPEYDAPRSNRVTFTVGIPTVIFRKSARLHRVTIDLPA